MRANIPKTKAKPPRVWQRLREDERQAIIDYVRECLAELVRDNLDHEEAELQKTWLKMMCIANHDVLKVGKIRAIRVLARWKRLYHIISKFKTNEERDAYLDRELEKIFGKDGYPEKWVDSLEEGGKS
jgi:hypothetical protein